MIETTENYIREMITPRPRDAHKGTCGRVLLVCGSVGMAGAAVMCAKAALRSGAGLVTVAVPDELFHIVQTAVPEAMCIDQFDLLEGDLSGFDAVAIGPGIGVGQQQYRMLEHLLTGSYQGPLIIDADGINTLCAHAWAPVRETYMATKATSDTDTAGIPRKQTSLLPDITALRKAPVILTPHPGEADRLLASLEQQKYKEQGRENAASALARASGAIIVLKGPETLVADGASMKALSTAHAGAQLGTTPDDAQACPEVDLFRNPTGNPGMATGGSGDVLTGVIAAIVAYGQAGKKQAGREGGCATGQSNDLPAFALGLTPLDATRTAVYMHGLAGDIAADRIGEIGMTAMDIIDALPAAFKRIAGR